MKLEVQRLVKIWISDTYEVDEITPEIIQNAIDYGLNCYESDTFWETLVDLGPAKVFDEKGKFLGNYNINE